jgi:diaminohydroxyphosphoribosylaminopyrimidine deaminase / 5-amino-6-(5-phosphoribosylamino)uracil reductase
VLSAARLQTRTLTRVDLILKSAAQSRPSFDRTKKLTPFIVIDFSCVTISPSDEQFLRRALELARQGIGLASPNPCVGAVIVDTGANIAGEGFYTYDGMKHAEILALEQARDRARGATLYINLEPHAHQGRTPPCTDALITAGIRRVVASMADPNPRVCGRGFQQLRAAGIQVETGTLEADARRLNEAFARYTRSGLPLVTLKSAMTLNAKIAPSKIAASKTAILKIAASESGAAQEPGIPPGGWITGATARAHVHEQRHASDAIMVGIGTILADDPLLTDRSGKPRRRPLLRVILDSHLRLPMESRLAQSAISDGINNDVLVFCSSSNEQQKHKLEARGIRVEKVPASSDGRIDIHSVLRRLGELEITSLMIEGGSTLNRTALNSGIVDKIFFYYAPKIFSSESVPLAAGGEFGQDETPQATAKPIEAKNIRLHRFGDDFAIEGYLRDPYAS